MNKPFKFRVSYRQMDRKTALSVEKSYSHFTFSQAKRHYKLIVLSLYRNKALESWEACLNRETTEPWEAPIHQDSYSFE